MEQRTIHDIPTSDQDLIRQYVRAHTQAMSAAERRIAETQHSSLAQFVADLAFDLAKLLGYAISIPVAWAVNIVESIGYGVLKGFETGYEANRIRREG